MKRSPMPGISMTSVPTRADEHEEQSDLDLGQARDLHRCCSSLDAENS